MVIYIPLFIISVVSGILLTGKNASKSKKIIYLALNFGLMFLVSVLRFGMGNDYFSYMRIFDEISAAGWGETLTLGYEPLFAVITKLISALTDSYEVMYGVYSALILTPVAVAVYKWSDNVWISTAAYLCLTFFYASLSFIRQSLAVSLLILAFGFIKERKILPVLIFAVAAIGFHYTAAAFIPLYLLSLVKPTKKYMIIFGSVSVGALITCLVMKAVGANPLNLVADIVTAVTGRDYSSYIGTTWFETGFDVRYLIMPLAVLGLVLVSYFLGWKEKKESDTLLQFMLMSAAIWLFITYAFIVERFTMYIFIFSLFAIPSVLSWFEEKAELAAAPKDDSGKKLPGYSKKKSEEKKDTSFLVTTITVFGMFVYNCWSIGMNFHGISPFMSNIPAVNDLVDGYDGHEENLTNMRGTNDLYTYLIQLGNTDCGYVIVSTSDSYDGIVPAIRRAADYAGTGINRPSDIEAASPAFIEYNDRNGVYYTGENPSYSAENGISIVNNGTDAVVTDKLGNTAKIADGKLAFLLFNEEGIFFDGTAFEVDKIGRVAEKVSPNE